MAQPAMFAAGVTAAVGAGQLAVMAQRLMANITCAYLMGAIGTKESLAINAGRGQAICMSQMSIVA